MLEVICKHYIVSGRVQGVWFRAHTEKRAKAIGVTGWVRNLPDGNVELVACGLPQQLIKLEEWLHIGPENSIVESLLANEVPAEEFANFEVRRT